HALTRPSLPQVKNLAESALKVTPLRDRPCTTRCPAPLCSHVHILRNPSLVFHVTTWRPSGLQAALLHSSPLIFSPSGSTAPFLIRQDWTLPFSSVSKVKSWLRSRLLSGLINPASTCMGFSRNEPSAVFQNWIMFLGVHVTTR